MDIQTALLKKINASVNSDEKNTPIVKFINIDSACRPNLNTPVDNFSFDLTETIHNVISISMYSVEIPQSWYTFAKNKGTSSFILYITVDGEITSIRHLITIPDGNYTIDTLIIATQKALEEFIPNTITLDLATNRITITFTDGELDTIYHLIWFSSDYSEEGLEGISAINSNFGWILGFRTMQSIVLTGSIEADSPIDPSGTKYIMMDLDDFHTSHINSHVVSINTLPNNDIKPPPYFNASIPQFRNGKDISVIHTPFLSEIKRHTINSINSNETANRTRFQLKGNPFAKIPFKKNDWACDPCKLFVDMSGPLQLQMREYFGPVNISSLAVELKDDKGNRLGLNGVDWSCTFIVRCMYNPH